MNGYPDYGLCKNGSIYSRKKGKWKRIKPIQTYFGYYVFLAYKNGERKQFKLHRVIAEHFIQNKKPSKFCQINHKDENKANNRGSNLEWIDSLGNNRAKSDRARITSRTFMTEELTYQIIASYVKYGAGCVRLSKAYGVKTATVYRLIKRYLKSSGKHR